MADTFLWVEQYRPNDIESCVLPVALKSTLTDFVNKGDVPNLILSGNSGVGKTTAAKAMLDELGSTHIMINGSEESGIDVLRTKIKILHLLYHFMVDASISFWMKQTI